MVSVVNTYRACYYQALYRSWCDVQQDRALTFGPRVLNTFVTPTSALYVPNISFSLNVIGSMTIDAVWLIAMNESCKTGPSLEILRVDKGMAKTAVVSGTPPFSGLFGLCYRGWPHTNAAPVVPFQALELLSTVSNYSLTTTGTPLRTGSTELITIRGTGFQESDQFYLMQGSANCSNPLAQFVADGSLLNWTLARWNMPSSISTVVLAFPLEAVGNVFICYIRSGATRPPVTLTPPLTIRPQSVDYVFPINQTYALNTFASFVLGGFGLNASADVAELHTSPACNDSAPISMTFIEASSSWLARMSQVGDMYICYEAQGGAMENVPSVHVTVIPSWYTSPLSPTVTILSPLIMNITGYGLNLKVNDSIWIQRASLPCTTTRPRLSALPVKITAQSAVFNVSISGQLKVCYSAMNPASATLTSLEIFQVTPRAPTNLAATTTSGWMNRRSEIVVAGGVGVDLTALGKVFDCSDSNETALEIVNASTFAFTPPRMGPFTFCYVNSGIVVSGIPVVAQPPVVLSTNFTAFANLVNATVTPQITLAQASVDVSLVVNGGDFNDLAYICSSNASAVTFSNQFPTVVAIAASPSLADRFTMVFQRAGQYDLCFSSAAAYPAPSQKIGTIVVEPIITQLTPTSIYSGSSTTITMSGVDIAKVSALFMVRTTTTPIASDPCSNTANLVPLVRPTSATFVAGALVRGVYSICYTGISKNVTLTAAAQILVTPLVLNITVQAASTVYTGCTSSALVTGTGIDPAIDLFYLSTVPGCGIVTIVMNLSSTQSPSLFAASFLPAETITYYLCYAASGVLQSASPYFGTITAQSPIQFTDSGTSSQYILQYLCAFPSAARFSFAIMGRSSGYWIPLDEALPQARLTIRYLPVQISLPIQVNVTVNNLTIQTSTVTVSAASSVVLCSQLPTSFSGSVTKQFAESIFAMMNFQTLGCRAMSGSSDVSIPLTQARNLLTQNRWLMTDPVVIVTAMANALQALTDPASVLSVLISTVPAVTPYQAIPDDQVQSQMLLMNNVFSIISQIPQNTVAMQNLVTFALNHLVQVGTTFCGGGASRGVTEPQFSLNVVKALPGAVSGAIVIGSSTTVTVSMSTPSSSGYCFVSVVLPKNPIPSLDGARQRHFAVQTITGPSMFNLPMFVVASNPYKSDSASVNQVQISLQYAASIQPNVTSSINGSMFAFSGTSWNVIPAAVIAGDFRSRNLVITLPQPNSSTTISGGIEFSPIIATINTPKENDLLVLLMGIFIVVTFVVAVLVGKRYDYAIESEGGFPDFSEDEVEKSVLGYRYIVLFRREAFHPVSTARRLTHVMVYFAAAYVAVVLIVRYATYDGFVSSAIGLLPGVASGLLATGGASVARSLLFQQLQDTPSILTGAVSLSAGAIAASFSSFVYAIPVICCVGPVVFLVAAFACRRPTRVVTENAILGSAAGWVLTFIVMVVSLAVAFYFGLTDLIPKQARDSKIVLTAWFWAIALDVAVLEPMKLWLLPRYHLWISQRALSASLAQNIAPANIAPPTAPKHEPFRFPGGDENDDTRSMRSTLDDMSEVLEFDEVDYKPFPSKPRNVSSAAGRSKKRREPTSRDLQTSPSEISLKSGFESVSRPDSAVSLSEVEAFGKEALELGSTTDFESVRSDSTTSYAAVPPAARPNNSFVVHVRDPIESTDDEASVVAVTANPVDQQFPPIRNRRFVMPY